MLAGRLFGAPVLDRLIPTDLAVDPRVVVIALDGRLGEVNIVEAQHLRAAYFHDLAQLASEGGARAVAYVDFDSLSFSDGASGRKVAAALMP